MSGGFYKNLRFVADKKELPDRRPVREENRYGGIYRICRGL